MQDLRFAVRPLPRAAPDFLPAILTPDRIGANTVDRSSFRCRVSFPSHLDSPRWSTLGKNGGALFFRACHSPTAQPFVRGLGSHLAQSERWFANEPEQVLGMVTVNFAWHSRNESAVGTFFLEPGESGRLGA
jgi:hypothetical protein